MKKILIIYATAGIGHKKASMAVKKALDEMAPKDTEVTMIDALDYTNKFFKWSYLQAYLFMVNKLPTFWGIAYYLTDNYYINMMVAKIRRLNNWMNSGKLVKYIDQTKPEPVFSKKLDRKAIFHKTGLKEGVFTILVIGGGFGVGPIEDIVKEVGKLSVKVQMAVVCGHNDDLVLRIEALKPTLPCDVKVLGFIDNVYEYMEISDILISKSGGITVSESLAKELPMIVISPIIGQETRNCDFIVKHNTAFRISRVQELKAIVEDLVRHPDKDRSMKDSIILIKKPMACFDVAKLALEDYCGK
ncbi:MAG: glycosyltransferase [Candidatus Omnitrophica bacterium]|nr:glycosyltransferase [Candidatus Omnitrophota bacterium]